jgi:hypothetical protein
MTTVCPYSVVDPTSNKKNDEKKQCVGRRIRGLTRGQELRK